MLVAGSGEEGLELAGLERPNLILLDLRLPRMSGWDVLMAIKADQRLRRIPMIIMTATVPESEEYKIWGVRAAGYLAKPFSADELMRQVKQVLGG